MTAANLAVIFGPNLLQKERGADSNHHIYAMGIEDSTAIINVTLVLVQNYRRLFTVRANMQLKPVECFKWVFCGVWKFIRSTLAEFPLLKKTNLPPSALFTCSFVLQSTAVCTERGGSVDTINAKPFFYVAWHEKVTKPTAYMTCGKLQADF